jgi:hypothetical protein
MRTPFAAILLPILAFVALSAAPLRAQVGGDCSDERASYVPGSVQDLQPWRTCYMKLRVLGVVISLPGKRCPTGHTYVASHLECLGLYAEGVQCAENGFVPIELELCRCVPHGGHGSSISSCECHDAGAIGFVATGHTVLCH